jgi:uncharacterized delta-60 repeat protein
MKNTLLLIIIVLTSFSAANAQDGTLDTTFGVNGIVETNIDAKDLVQQKLLPNNKMLVLINNDNKTVLHKFNEDGTIDNSFGNNGHVIFASNHQDSIDYDGSKIGILENGVKLLSDRIDYSCSKLDVYNNGKILLLENKRRVKWYEFPNRPERGDSIYATVTSSIIRINTNGGIDNTFEDNGYKIIYNKEYKDISWNIFKQTFPLLTDANIRPNNTVLIGGRPDTEDANDQRIGYEVFRLNYDGSFNSSITSSPSVKGGRFVIDHLENVYVLQNGDGSEIEIRKYSQNGINDLNFADQGVLSLNHNSIFGYNSTLAMWVSGLEIDSNNNLLCAAYLDGHGSDKSIMFRVKPDGALDNTFGNNGIKLISLTEFGSDKYIYSKSLLSKNGSIILLGLEMQDGTDQQQFILKLDADGSSNSSFGSGGIVFNNSFYDGDKLINKSFFNYEFVVRPDNQNIVISTTKNEKLYFARYNNSRIYSNKHTSGDVYGIWDVDTVYVDGDITIPKDKSLIIKPNTNIFFTGEYKFDVFGQLIANGTETDSISFLSNHINETNNYPYYENFWYGITFHSTDENNQPISSLDYCNIKYAFPTWLDEMSNIYGGGLVFYKSKINVSHTKFTDCIDGNLDRGVLTAIHSSGKIDGISLLKTTTYRAGTITLLNSDVEINDLYMYDAYGLYIDKSKVKIRNSVIDNCSPYIQYGIINSKDSEVEITDCEITNNKGIGVMAKFSSFTIKYSKIKDNNKAGILSIETPLVMENCEIIENGDNGLRFISTENWDTIFSSDIRNCLIAKNIGSGLKFADENNATITNCTIADNVSSSSWGGVSCSDKTHLKNCIVYNNGNNLDFQAGGLYTYSIIQGNYVGSDEATTNIENIDPLFRDASNGDYHLQSTSCGSPSNSPGIDAGDPNIRDYILDCASAGLSTTLSDIGAYGGDNNRWDRTVIPECHYIGEVSGIWDCNRITIDGNILIPEGDTLIISESVKKILITGPYQIKVEGVLLAIGPNREDETKLDNDFIVFQGNDWKGILFNNLNNSNVGTSIISSCRFDYANKLDMDYQGGGAIAIYNSDKILVENSLFYANSAKFGGAMYIANSSPIIENCHFELNGRERKQDGKALTTAGGALYIKDANPYLHKLKFISNYSISGGGAMVVENSPLTISNLLFAKNSTNGLGGAVEITSNSTGSLLSLVNITSTNNVSKPNGGGSFHVKGQNTELEIINSILYDNTKVEIFNEGQEPRITYSIVDASSSEAYFGEGCSDVDPYLVEGAYYKLSNNKCSYGGNNNVVSPAIDAGHPDSTDVVLDCLQGLGTKRADMGYYGGRYSDTNGGLSLEKEITNQHVLSQNYPNPFNQNTTISFYLPKSEIVSLKIYDILGEEIATLIDGKMKKGIQSIIFKASYLSPGVYFYKITIGEYTEVKRMVLN